MALHSKEAILDKMCVALGGRAAEDRLRHPIYMNAYMHTHIV